MILAFIRFTGTNDPTDYQADRRMVGLRGLSQVGKTMGCAVLYFFIHQHDGHQINGPCINHFIKGINAFGAKTDPRCERLDYVQGNWDNDLIRRCHCEFAQSVILSLRDLGCQKVIYTPSSISFFLALNLWLQKVYFTSSGCRLLYMSSNPVF